MTLLHALAQTSCVEETLVDPPTPQRPSLTSTARAHSSAIVDMLHNSGPTAFTVLVILLIMPASSPGPS